MYKVGRSRTPQGVRGLKPADLGQGDYFGESHSARSAWIETLNRPMKEKGRSVALRKECVD